MITAYWFFMSMKMMSMWTPSCLPEGESASAQDKNGWVPLGSGSLTTDENFLAQYSKDGDLSKYITGLGLKNTSG